MTVEDALKVFRELFADPTGIPEDQIQRADDVFRTGRDRPWYLMQTSDGAAPTLCRYRSPRFKCDNCLFARTHVHLHHCQIVESEMQPETVVGLLSSEANYVVWAELEGVPVKDIVQLATQHLEIQEQTKEDEHG